MNSRRIFLKFAYVIAFAVLPHAAIAQTASQCALTPLPQSKGMNLFNAQQELELGDIVAESVASQVRVIDSDELNAPLQQVGHRLLQSFGYGDTVVHFYIVDLPAANAFGIPGHVYVTRKLIVQMRSEDELAALLAHELGHLLTHQAAIETSHRFQRVLGVKQVTDRQDIFNKYHELLDQWRRKPQELTINYDRDQSAADDVSVQALARAGYDPEAAVSLFDRIANSNTGAASFWSSFFGQATPEQKRLREIVRAAVPLRGCQRNAAPLLPNFGAWQQAVLSYSLARKETLHGVVFKKQVTPPFKSDLLYMHFSPDGKYLLAQDDANIYLLSRDGLKFLFRIEAQDAQEAQFTPDGKSIVFAGAGLRIEQWSVDSQQRTAVHELAPARPCWDSALSPDGRHVVCLNIDAALMVYDTNSGQAVFTRKDFYELTFDDVLRVEVARLVGLTRIRLAGFSFSPDSRYLLVGAPHATAAIDLVTMRDVQIGGALRDAVQSRQFSFVSPDRVIAVNEANAGKSHVFRFPSGAAESTVSIGIQDLQQVARGNYALLRPVTDHAVGLLDIAQNKLIAASDNPAFDTFANVFCSQRKDGTLQLRDLATRAVIAEAELPNAPLGSLQAFAVSPNEQWIAISGRTRGGIWNLERGERAFQLVPFTSAAVYDDGVSLLDFPANHDKPGAVAALDPAQPFRPQHLDLPKDESAAVYGRFVLMRRFGDSAGKKALTYEIHDEHEGNKVLWSRTFVRLSAPPGLYVDPDSESLALLWNVGQQEVREELKDDADLKAKLGAAVKDNYNDYVEVINFRSGKRVASFLINTGKESFELRSVLFSGDWFVAFDNHNRGLVFSVHDGREFGHVFGSRGTINGNAKELAIENEPGQVEIYDLTSMTKRDEYGFPTGVAAMRFNADGKRLFVLTRGQTAYSLDVTQKPDATQAAR